MNDRPKAVLFISHDASRTGAPMLLLRFLRWFRQNQQIPLRILIGRSGELLPEFEQLGPVDLFEPKRSPFRKILYRMHVRPRISPLHLSSLRQKLLQSQIGAIYSNTIANGKILDFLSFLNCPVICHVHELSYGIHCAGADNLELVKKHSSSYIAVSQAVKRNLVENQGIPEPQIRMIYGFVPGCDSRTSEMVNSSAVIRQELGIPSQSKLVCACGSIEPRKGTDLFLRVAAKITEKCKAAPVHFIWIGGDREQLSAVRKEIRSSSLQSVVQFIGHRLDVRPYYAASDIFLLPSREDAFPLVVLEAALQGKPIVCFEDSGGTAEFVEDDAGFAVPGFDVNQMAEKVMELLRFPELCSRMGAVARDRVLRRHDLRTGAPKIVDLIEETLRRTGRERRCRLAV